VTLTDEIKGALKAYADESQIIREHRAKTGQLKPSAWLGGWHAGEQLDDWINGISVGEDNLPRVARELCEALLSAWRDGCFIAHVKPDSALGRWRPSPAISRIVLSRSIISPGSDLDILRKSGVEI